MTDLVKRLRGPVKHPQQSVTLRLDAADEIERLHGLLTEIHDEALPWVEMPKKLQDDICAAMGWENDD